jgi:hypothetical protein
VAQVVDARVAMGTAIHPAQLIPQFVEDPMNLTITQGLAQSMASRADEERRIGCRLHLSAA